MAHTIKGCNNCENDYMFHNDDSDKHSEICQECYDNFCLVLHDLQSADELSIVTEYDYKKHKIGNPIFFRGTRTECEEWRKNNTPILKDIQDITSSIALEDIKNWDVAHLFVDKPQKSKEENFMIVTSAYWRSDKIIRSLCSFRYELLKKRKGDVFALPTLNTDDVRRKKNELLDDVEKLKSIINQL